jgi:signal transduction histidine kinase
MVRETHNLIMVVDDEAPQLRALCDTLQDNGYSPVGFASAGEALAAMAEIKPDLLLADLMMPGMDGIELLRAAHEHDPDLVCIIMTGHGTIDTAVEAMKSGALDYILKPFRLSAVLPVLTRALTIRRLRIENAILERRVRQHVIELETANRDLDSFVTSVSHDLKAPVRAITGFSEMLIESSGQLLPEADAKLLQKIHRNSQHMQELIEGLLTLSRYGRQALARQNVDLAVLANTLVTDLRRENSGRQIEVRIGYLPVVVGDASLLRQVFVNLLSNAFKFTRATELAVIEAGSFPKAGEEVYFVRDNGAGFDMQYASNLFGVFQRLHNNNDFEGTGVGLSIVRRIIERHGGTIWAEAEVGKGAAFYFTLAPKPGGTADESSK